MNGNGAFINMLSLTWITKGPPALSSAQVATPVHSISNVHAQVYIGELNLHFKPLHLAPGDRACTPKRTA